ncbi:FAD-dependent oxidoreductase [Paenibacillus rhizovicinus]|uniref:FAD-dependent oxidoreductase n=1 Tax=Paenibacillus rhizovicinus TaxID=2704463 RepID=A0A6C0P8Y0_9BACL|nr:FAD-dependent oxidoreductase [Paenibacillus rhizovicinus]QHW34876.1 FAD-dependent oxidoreductase [Paenibacillus rhizovicinus]
MQLPQYPASYWKSSQPERASHPKLEQDIETEVVVVGAGIAGITTAYLLIQQGLRVVLVEAGEILNGTTAHTTAKITAQHDLIYDELIKSAGFEKALLYYQASAAAISFIKQTVEEHGISCGFAEQEAYVYTNDDTYVPKLENEAKAYEKLGISGAYVDTIPLSLPMLAAVQMSNQAQFHPLQYLSKLVDLFVEKGGEVYAHTTAVDVSPGDRPVVITSDGRKLICKHVVSCTHFPFYDGHGFYFSRMHADRSYVLGLEAEEAYPGGMYLSAEDPKRSIRSAEMSNGTNLIIVGGQSHKTGQGICTIHHYEELQKFAENHFRMKKISYRWSAQDLVTGDKIPFIGRITASSPNVYIATGFRKWGMTNATAAALLIKDLITENPSSYEELYAPSRAVSLKTIGSFISDNVDVAKHLISGKLEHVTRRPEQLENDEGAVVHVNGKRAGGYRDRDGRLYLVDTTCTHMGCEVEWNNGDRTWDCPCHGSRFSISGDVIEGPAEKPLVQIQV